MRARIAIVAVLLATASAIVSSDVRGGFTLTEAEKNKLRPICADQITRDKIVAQQIKNGGEYERIAAKSDLDIACEQLDLSETPVHDAVDLADAAGHSNWIYDARWSPDGKTIVTAGRDKSVRIWDVETGKTIRRIDVGRLAPSKQSADHGIVRRARFIDGGRAIVVTADAHPVRVFDVATGEPVAELPYKNPDPPFIETSASGLVVLGGSGGDIVVYDVKAKSERYRMPGVANEYPYFAVSNVAGLLAVALPGSGESVRVQVVNLETGKPVWQTEVKDRRSTGATAFSRDGSLLAVAVNGRTRIYSVADKRLVTTIFTTPYFPGNGLAFTADGKGLVSCLRHAMLWDVATGKRLHHFGPFMDLCHSVDVSPDGKYLVTGHIGSDGRIWEIATGTFYRRLGKNVHPPG